jgi:hypothetical protein
VHGGTVNSERGRISTEWTAAAPVLRRRVPCHDRHDRRQEADLKHCDAYVQLAIPLLVALCWCAGLDRRMGGSLSSCWRLHCANACARARVNAARAGWGHRIKN